MLASYYCREDGVFSDAFRTFHVISLVYPHIGSSLFLSDGLEDAGKVSFFSFFFLPFRRPLSSSRPVSVLCSLFSHITMSPQPFLTLNSDHRHDFDYDYDNSSEISTHRNISFLYSVSDPSGISTAEILKCNLDNGFLVLNAAQEVEEQDAVDARDRLGQSSTHEPLQLFLYSQDEPFSDEPEQF